MALDRVNNPSNPAFPDRIKIVNMETGANINYNIQPLGDMWDNLHPYHFGQGYSNMAEVWFNALKDILPSIRLSPPANFRIVR